MRRLARRLFTICSAVSLVLCVAVCMLWGLSRVGVPLSHHFVSGGHDGGWRVYSTRLFASGDGTIRLGRVVTTHQAARDAGADQSLLDLHTLYSRNLRVDGDLTLRIHFSHGPPPPPLPPPTNASRLGFTFFFKSTSPVSKSDPQYGTTAGWRVGLPHWFVVLVTVLPPLALSRLSSRTGLRLFPLCSAVSLVLCVAVCVLWVRSYRAPFTVRLSGDRYHFHVATSAGGTVVVRLASNVDSSTGQFAFKTLAPTLAISYVVLALTTGLLPLIWGGRLVWRNRRRPQPGLCPSCGYDLRASPERCPECGAAVGIKSGTLA